MKGPFIVQQPFPHLLLTDMWPPQLLAAIAEEFPEPNDKRWITYPLDRERGKKAGGFEMWGPYTRAFFNYVQGASFLGRLKEWTGLEGLVADTLGGGMHLTAEGGRLGMHTDFSRHPDPRMAGYTRCLNLLVFLNPEWKQEWGGTLYLGAHKEVAVLPILNTTCIFETSATSWHGHPDPIVGNRVRRSLAAYYWRPTVEGETRQETTVWQ